jgi:hypothetical protein
MKLATPPSSLLFDFTPNPFQAPLTNYFKSEELKVLIACAKFWNILNLLTMI